MVSPIQNSFNRKKGFFDHPVYWDVNNNYRVCLGHCMDDEFVQFGIDDQLLVTHEKPYVPSGYMPFFMEAGKLGNMPPDSYIEVNRSSLETRPMTSV